VKLIHILDIIVYIITTAVLFGSYVYMFLVFTSIKTLGYFHTSEPNLLIANGEFFLLLATLPFTLYYFYENLRFIVIYAKDLIKLEEEVEAEEKEGEDKSEH